MNVEILLPNVSYFNPALSHNQLSGIPDENKLSECYQVEKLTCIKQCYKSLIFYSFFFTDFIVLE